jgi:hypothetical protein
LPSSLTLVTERAADAAIADDGGAAVLEAVEVARSAVVLSIAVGADGPLGWPLTGKPAAAMMPCMRVCACVERAAEGAGGCGVGCWLCADRAAHGLHVGSP